MQLKFVKLSEFSEFGKRIHDSFVSDAVGDPDEARTAEGLAFSVPDTIKTPSSTSEN